jgi:hypothetical protein
MAGVYPLEAATRDAIFDICRDPVALITGRSGANDHFWTTVIEPSPDGDAEVIASDVGFSALRQSLTARPWIPHRCRRSPKNFEKGSQLRRRAQGPAGCAETPARLDTSDDV